MIPLITIIMYSYKQKVLVGIYKIATFFRYDNIFYELGLFEITFNLISFSDT